MSHLMRCVYCGCLQDEPPGVKACARCGGELIFEASQPPTSHNYLQTQMELDQITAPADTAIERYLILTIHTPAQVPAAEAAPTKTGRQPLGFVTVLDVSGSMQGEKIQWAKKAVRQAVHYLHEGDMAALVTFASQAETLLPPTRVEASLRQRLEAALGDLNASGQTALCDGLEAGIAAARQQPQEVNLILLLSDGQANVGEIDLEKIGARALEAKRQKIMVSTLGVGEDYNEALMAEIATQGGGRFYHLQQAQQIAPYVAGELGEASALVARNVVLHLSLPTGAGLGIFSAAYHVQENAQVRLGDIPADTTLEIAIQLRLPAQAAGSRLKIEGHLTYLSPADHTLQAALNPVTVRYVASQQFAFRDGAVAPVVHRVLEQMRATGVLKTARAAKHEAMARQVTQESIGEVKHYAELLGADVAQALAEEYESNLDQMQASLLDAKMGVARAYAKQRGSKKF